MSDFSKLRAEQVKWADVKHLVEKHDQKLAGIIDGIASNKKYKLYKMSYPFGVNIVDCNGLTIPLKNGETVPLSHPDVPKELAKALSYSSLPMGIILNHSVEVYNEFDGNIATLAVFKQGVPLGLLEVLEPEQSFCIKKIWNVSSGLRSSFMLPKITDKVMHTKLMTKLGCQSGVPRRALDDFPLFAKMADSGEVDWNVEVLFFSEEWFERRDDYDWLKFYNYLHEYLFKYTGISRNNLTFEFVWHAFAKELTSLKKKTDTYTLDTLKHLVKLAVGALPGFAPFAGGDTGGPFKFIQDLYVDEYKLQYAPTIIEPRHFAIFGDKQPIYYSLHNPTLFESNPRNRAPESLVTDLAQIQSLMRNFSELLKSNKIYLGETIIKDILKSVQFDYFHFSEDKQYFGIQNNKQIPIDDPRFVDYNGKKLKFSAASGFVQNCIRISESSSSKLKGLDDVIHVS